ncbi:hypothetical protein Q4503_10130 [Colwellia sp. 6_MG-2023]|uniref:hypothetical protein n=1 Tax=Colwellia sp. 6_MG-2023 TaxID=3062676 RepID=UPI0026E316C6|nr:hypothetical protein [Colwellia sp. 6_MG-2023]MDO6488058.1 hypothetical protein [Colwellia sp. 6_MG-2023]
MTDNSYTVSRVTYNCRLEVNSVEHKPSLFVSTHKHLAHEQINIMVTELEQDGFDVTDQFEAPLCTIARLGWNFHSPTFVHNIKFYGVNHPKANEFLFQKVPAGVQVMVMVDDQGKLSINDLEDTFHILVSDEKVNGNARLFLEVLSQQDGFRSCVLEAVYDGQNLYVTDGSYIHDTDLRKMPFEKRYETLSMYIGNTQKNKVCGLIKAEHLPPEQWGYTSRNGFVKALMAKRKNSLCSLYRTGDNSTSTVIIGEREPSKYECVKTNKGIAILRQEGSKKSLTIRYPELGDRMMLKSLQVIGPVNTTEPAFIF